MPRARFFLNVRALPPHLQTTRTVLRRGTLLTASLVSTVWSVNAAKPNASVTPRIRFGFGFGPAGTVTETVADGPASPAATPRYVKRSTPENVRNGL